MLFYCGYNLEHIVLILDAMLSSLCTHAAMQIAFNQFPINRITKKPSLLASVKSVIVSLFTLNAPAIGACMRLLAANGGTVGI
jgi:hypothetical protein